MGVEISIVDKLLASADVYKALQEYRNGEWSQRAVFEEIQKVLTAPCPHEWIRRRDGRQCFKCGWHEAGVFE